MNHLRESEDEQLDSETMQDSDAIPDKHSEDEQLNNEIIQDSDKQVITLYKKYLDSLTSLNQYTTQIIRNNGLQGCQHKAFPCSQCDKTYSRRDCLNEHKRKAHGVPSNTDDFIVPLTVRKIHFVEWLTFYVTVKGSLRKTLVIMY